MTDLNYSSITIKLIVASALMIATALVFLGIICRRNNYLRACHMARMADAICIVAIFAMSRTNYVVALLFACIYWSFRQIIIGFAIKDAGNSLVEKEKYLNDLRYGMIPVIVACGGAMLMIALQS